MIPDAPPPDSCREQHRLQLMIASGKRIRKPNLLTTKIKNYENKNSFMDDNCPVLFYRNGM